MEHDALVEGLTEAQRAAVTSRALPLCVMAGAGSGKTLVLTRRIAYGAAEGWIDPDHALALTFTRKAAGELRRRLGALGVAAPVAAGTFHGVALAQLRRRWDDQGRRPPAILSDPARLLTPLLSAANHPGPQATAATAREISWAHARQIGPVDYVEAALRADHRMPVPAQVVGAIYAGYEQEKHRRRVMDLDDIIVACARALEADRAFAEHQRWRWRHFFVDEYQDLNPACAALLHGWLGDRVDLCVVGDPQQAIYGWNGADPSLLDSFTTRYPTAEVVHLTDNFRSSEEIVTVARAVLASGSSVTEPTATSPQRVGTASATDSPVPVVSAYRSEALEATAIARAVRDSHAPGTPWSRIAVLARTKAQLVVLGAALDSADIPSRFQGGRRLAELAAVRDLLAPSVPDQPARVLLGDIALARAELATAHRDELGCLLDAVQEYLDLDPTGSVESFRRWLECSGRIHVEAASDAVALSTFHRAKGLEWPIVFVSGLEEGLVPMAGAHGPALAEEQRLLYVALTRAQTELRCSWAATRVVGHGEAIRRRPSRFLTSLEGAVADLRTARQPADGRPHVRAVRRQLAALRPPDIG